MENIYFKIGVECGATLYYTKKFDSFEELIKYVKETIRKYGWDMFLCNLIIQAYKDNSYDFQNACFMQETLSFGSLRAETVEQVISELIRKNTEQKE